MDDFLAEPFRTEDRDGVWVITAIPRKLGPMEAEALVDLVFDPDAEPDAHPHVIIDLTGVEYMNSATMSVLFRTSQTHELRLVGLTPDAEHLLVTMGFMHLLDADPTVDVALANLKRA